MVSAVSCCEPGSSSALLQGSIKGNVGVVDEQLAFKPLLLLHKGLGGLNDTAWHLAAAYGRLSILECLYRHLEGSIKVITEELNRRSKRKGKQYTEAEAMIKVVNLLNVKGQTPLMFACYAGRSDCAEFLVKQGADAWIPDLCGRRTALHYAAMKGHGPCILTVCAHTPQHQLQRESHRGVVMKLVDLTTVCGFTPLHYAARSKVEGALSALLQYNADLLCMSFQDGLYDIITSPKWTTALHVAAQAGFDAGAREMLRHYVACRDSGRYRDPRLSVDSASRMPFHVAQIRGYRALAQMLHPSYSLDQLFPTTELDAVGVPRLSIIAARVVQLGLLSLVDVADAKIATLPPLEPATSMNISSAASLKRAGSARARGMPMPRSSAHALGTVLESQQGSGGGSGQVTRLPPQVPAGPSHGLTTVSSSKLENMLRSGRNTLPRLLKTISRPWGGSDDGKEPEQLTTFSALPGTIRNSGNNIDPFAGDPAPALGSASQTIFRGSRNGATGADGTATAYSRAPPGLPRGRSSTGSDTGPKGSPLNGSPRGRSPIRTRVSSPFAGAAAGGVLPVTSLPQRATTAGELAELDWWSTPPPELPLDPVGAPMPGDKTADMALGRAPSLMDRVRSITKKRTSRPGAGTGSQLELPTNSPRAEPSSMPSAAQDVQSADRRTGGRMASPFAAISWGTSEMVASLPSVDQCVVCLDEIYALVIVPCLHRVCVPCARRLVMTIKEKPLACPVCRGGVKGAYAPHDMTALEDALSN